MRRFFITFVAIGLFSLNARAGNGLWEDGKDNPKRRVNVGLESLSPNAYLNISEAVDEAVVNISTTQVIKAPAPGGLFPRFHGRDSQERDSDRPRSPFEDFFGGDPFGDFFFQPGPQQDMRRQSLGSGFVLNADGLVVTNNHVVEHADEIKVVLADETEFLAKVVGKDRKTDLALLKIEPKKKLKNVVLGDSAVLKVGEVVVAIGNPFGLSHSVTQGIVSAKERSIGAGPYDDFIQTDASINPGNSGGPLLNLYGEVIGINTAIVATGQGIGFAIPINMAKEILAKIKKDGRVVRGQLGVMIQKLTDEHAKALKLPAKEGALVADVQDKSAAQKAGLKAGDVIVRFDGKQIKEWQELPIAVANTKVGKKVKIDIIRDGKRMSVGAIVQELKDEETGDPKSETSGADLLGLSVESVTPNVARSLGLKDDYKGVYVANVDQAGPAFSKGIRAGDVILELNRQRIQSKDQYSKEVSKIKKGDTVLLLVKRGAGTLFVAFTLS